MTQYRWLWRKANNSIVIGQYYLNIKLAPIWLVQKFSAVFELDLAYYQNIKLNTTFEKGSAWSGQIVIHFSQHFGNFYYVW